MTSTSAPPIITLSSLTYLQPATLAPLLLDAEHQQKIAIVDVRDSDHIGGNIKGSVWVPVNQLDTRLPELLRTLRDKEKVVFHCMLSQQRGPKAALMYARARQRADAKEAKSQEEAGRGDGTEEPQQQKPVHEICVLEGGFGSWQTWYGEDARLTADYQADLWE
jgi:Cdc25 family phosphatase